MSAKTYLVVMAVHMFGVILWIGSMVCLTILLAAHARAAEAGRAALAAAERGIARIMEVGSLLAIVGGVIMVVGSAAPVSPLKQPYFHIKLTLVVVLLALHGFTRVKMARLGRGQGSGPSSAIPIAILLAAAAIVALVVLKPMARI